MAVSCGHKAPEATNHYIRESMARPMLSRERETEIACRWQEEQDDESLHELVNAHAKLVVAAATRLRNYGLPLADLLQEGNVGLMQAAARFDPSRGFRFSTYAGWWVRSAMQDYILRNWSIVRLGSSANQKTLFFNLRRLRAKIEGGPAIRMSDESRQEISKTLEVPVGEVEAMENRFTGSDMSLNAPIGEGGEADWQSQLTDTRPSPEDVVAGQMDGAARSRWLAAALGELPDRERMIIRERRLVEEGATLEQLGQQLGVSKERVRQLEHRALAKLRDLMITRVEDAGDMVADI